MTAESIPFADAAYLADLTVWMMPEAFPSDTAVRGWAAAAYRRQLAKDSEKEKERQRQKASDDAFRKEMKAEKERIAKNDYSFKPFYLGPPPPPKIRAPKKDGDDDDDDHREGRGGNRGRGGRGGRRRCKRL